MLGSRAVLTLAVVSLPCIRSDWSDRSWQTDQPWVDPFSFELNVTNYTVDGQPFRLVFSDEFEYAAGNNSFKDSDKWSATYALNTDTYGGATLKKGIIMSMVHENIPADSPSR